MACMKLGSKTDSFQRQGQAWFCTTGLPSDVVVEVGQMSFHLHKFPLLSRSGLMEKLISEASASLEKQDQKCVINLSDIPAGPRTFELIAKFCYGVKLELTASNVVPLRCAAEHLIMSEEYGEGNLIAKTETFLNQTVVKSWRDSLRALQSCGDEDILPYADELNITDRCIMSLAAKALTDPNIFGWPVVELGGPPQSPGGSVLWNGISTGARPMNLSSGWWYEDVSGLSLPIYKRLILAMESRGIRPEVITGSLVSYTRQYLPGLNRHQDSTNLKSDHRPGLSPSLPEEAQKALLEEIGQLLPMQKGLILIPTKFLFGLLRTAIILRASSSCTSNLEKRIGAQLDQATLEDLLIPTFSYSTETLYDVDCMQRILEHFLASNQTTGGPQTSPSSGDEDHLIGSPASLTPVTKVAKLVDGYLAEVASDVNLKLPKFQALAAAIPEHARPYDDGLYRAIDIYLKSHPWLSESEREQLCRLMDCQKLSIEACTHAAQNERLPLRIIVQVLFFEQLQLRTSIAGCLLVSDNLDQSRPLRSGPIPGATEGGWATAVRENQVLRVGMDSMKMRVAELEKECESMKQEIEKLGRVKNDNNTSSGMGIGGRTWGNVTRKFGFKMKSQMCSAEEEFASEQQGKGKGQVEKVKAGKGQVEKIKEGNGGRDQQNKRLSLERER
ncbi:BTB/POZ domain-containing protein At1g30440 [Punica granatum]|uniref:BTB/POZ domain-containing protein At1g30440 n=1 Tax=Punica granatum TaxID=22663 RepID=A0A6P8ELK3_PUNGR|nr:BTB/POZ domain-containing protein At1g30440 [Punica granatum]